MQLAPKWISADSHVCEVPATWERARHAHGELAPKVVVTDQGTFLVVEGWTDHPRTLRSEDRKMLGDASVGDRAFVEEITHDYIGLALGKRGQVARLERERWRGKTGSFTMAGSVEAEDFMRNFRQEDYPGAGSDPAARLEDQDADNVAAEILYPSYLCRLYAISVTNEPFFRDIARSYSEWLIDFAEHDPRRLIAQPVLSVLNPDGAADDLRAYAARGVRSCAIASSVPLGTSYADPKFDPIWSAAVECGIVLAMHQNTGGFKHLSSNLDVLGATDPLSGRQNLRQFMGPQLEIIATLSELIYGGVLDRFPELRLVAAEFDVGWLPHIYQRRLTFTPRLGLQLAPSEYLARNFWFTFQDDRAGCLLAAQQFGADNFMWASDYPHPATTWPNSKADLERQFDGIGDDVRAKISYANVIALYGLDPTVVAAA
jgi:predicted TIM-barrel fold metal-dependent hydrolase